VVYDLLLKLRANPEQVEILGDGSQERDFVYVLDVVQAMMLAATAAPGKGEVYNVASGTTHSIAELARKWFGVCDLRPEVVYTGKIRPGDAEKWLVDLSKLRRLGFKPETSLEAGLVAIRDWYDASSP
jgi:UDP-glucose 4-epimerase